MNRTMFGLPLWLLLGVVGGGGYYLYDTHKKQAAAQAAAVAQAQQASAAKSSAGGSSMAGTPTSMDPQLVAYQAGEASGVASYSAGVTTGISLVDSIMSLFPGGATEQTQANQAAATAAGPGPATLQNPQVVTPNATAGPTGPAGYTGYSYISSWPLAQSLSKEGVQLYAGIPAGNGQTEYIPAPADIWKGGLPSGTALYTYTGVPQAAA